MFLGFLERFERVHVGRRCGTRSMRSSGGHERVGVCIRLFTRRDWTLHFGNIIGGVGFPDAQKRYHKSL